MPVGFRSAAALCLAWVVAAWIPVSLSARGSAEDDAGARPASEPSRISVGAQGEVSAVPDIATVTIGVRTADHALERAESENRRRIEAVLGALRELEVEDRDIRTTGYSVYLHHPPRHYRDNEYRDSEGDAEGEHRVSNTVQVTIREIGRLGEVIAAVTHAGANHVGGIRFEISNPDQVASEARISAMQAARAKAEELAAVEGLRIGRVLNIAEHEPHAPRTMLRTVETEADSVPVAPGELTHRVQVSVGYELLPQ